MTRRPRRRVACGTAVVAVALLAGTGASAIAQSRSQVTVGLYAPTAPFRGPSERLEYISKLASYLTEAADGRTVVGRVFVKASSFAAAVRKGDIQFAVVDAPYAAARGLPYEVLAAATRDGKAATPWMLAASGRVRGVGDLFGEVVAMPKIGAGEEAFLSHSLLEGEVEPSFFADVISAPDTFSALTLVSVGRARAALVPEGVSLPTGVSRVMRLREVGWPMFVALPGADRQLTKRFREHVLGFTGNVLTGFAAAASGRYELLRASLGTRRRRGPMAVPGEGGLAVEGLFGERTWHLPMSDLALLLTATADRDD